jgi:pyridoxamine 5'-phosphate oxidase family protein
MFTDDERAYLRSQPLARLATVSPTGQPDADVVGFELDGDEIVIGSYAGLDKSRKYKNIAAGGEIVSLIVDSLASTEPMQPVAVKVHGTASIEHREGRFGPMEYIVVRPRTTWSWGVVGPAFVDGQFRPHKQVWR